VLRPPTLKLRGIDNYGKQPNFKTNDMKNGEIIIAEHPNIPYEEKNLIYYIPSGYDLSKLDSSVLKLIDDKTRHFFLNYKEELIKFSKSVASKYVRAWIESLLDKNCFLTVILRGKSSITTNEEFVDSGSYVIFQNDHPEWIHSGTCFDFESRLHNPAAYHPALLELLKFAGFGFSYWYGGAKLLGLGEANIASDQPHLTHWLSGFEEDNIYIPVSELRIIYQDYCGSHFMCDNNNNIWCGGYEEGDFWKTELTMERLIDSIFSAHLAQEFPIISEIAEEKYI
jgi:hypothetical protein